VVGEPAQPRDRGEPVGAAWPVPPWWLQASPPDPEQSTQVAMMVSSV
jgi:hypothetical protein